MLRVDAIAEAVKDPKFLARFWAKVDKRGPDECWLWTGGASRAGYGVIALPMGSARVYAHRVSYIIAHGSIPAGMHVLHHCDRPRCVSPHCLFHGTDLDNVRDMISKGRQVSAQVKGEACGQSKLNEMNVREIRQRYAHGERSVVLAAAFNINRHTVNKICRRDTWAHLA